MFKRISNMIKKRGRDYSFKALLLFFTALSVALLPKQADAEENNPVYQDGIYRYQITSEANKEVSLIGIECKDVKKELTIPGIALINNGSYKVSTVYFQWDYYGNTEYGVFYQGVEKLNVSADFTGTLEDPIWAFPNIEAIEFYGETAPEKVNVSVTNRRDQLDIPFVVPKGTEQAYVRAIHTSMYYYVWSDLYEHEIELTPTIVPKGTDGIEFGCFQKNGLIYQVISPASTAGTGTGKVQLIGLTEMLDRSYVFLPKEIYNNGNAYELTKLCKFSMIGSGARVVVVPASVTEMESSVFDLNVELLFLSKNCKVIPSGLITDENNMSRLRFVSVPEGVTTISDKAFANDMVNESSIILPTTVKSLGTKSLYGLKLVTFLNPKPVRNIGPAISKTATVKVPSKVKSAYKSVLGKEYNIISAKNIVKSGKLSVNKSTMTLKVSKTHTLKGTLSKGSNETVYWLSSDPKIVTVSGKGTVKGKKAGTAYVIAYTRTSGLHKAVKVTVTGR